MALCEKCGEAFKPYWRLAEVEDKRCEKCDYLANEGKDKRIWTALIKIVLGFLLIIFLPQSPPAPFHIVGFLLVTFGVIKLIEDAIMHKRTHKGSL